MWRKWLSPGDSQLQSFKNGRIWNYSSDVSKMFSQEFMDEHSRRGFTSSQCRQWSNECFVRTISRTYTWIKFYKWCRWVKGNHVSHLHRHFQTVFQKVFTKLGEHEGEPFFLLPHPVWSLSWVKNDLSVWVYFNYSDTSLYGGMLASCLSSSGFPICFLAHCFLLSWWAHVMTHRTSWSSLIINFFPCSIDCIFLNLSLVFPWYFITCLF